MKLIVHELKASGLTQLFRAEKNYILEAVRPHIYRHNWPSGTLKVQVLDEDDNLLSESNPVNISEIGQADFFHGYVRFMVRVGLKKDHNYKFKIVGESGYTFDESGYIAVANDYDLRKYTPSNPNVDGLYAPLDIELWARSPR